MMPSQETAHFTPIENKFLLFLGIFSAFSRIYLMIVSSNTPATIAASPNPRIFLSGIKEILATTSFQERGDRNGIMPSKIMAIAIAAHKSLIKSVPYQE